MSNNFTINDFATAMEGMLAINKQCTADVQQVALDAIRIITGLCEGFQMDSNTLTKPLMERLMQAHQEAMNAVQEMNA